MTKKKRRIFITGAGGFIGKNLAEYLGAEYPKKYSLFCPCHEELELLDSGRVLKFIMRNKIDIIVHCASSGGTRKTAYDAGRTDVVSKNLRMFFNLQRSLCAVKKMIYFGSGAEYDMRRYKARMSERYFDSSVPEDAYGFSKYCLAKYTEKSERIINLRLFGVFGKYEDYGFKFISNAILKNLFGLPIIINQNARLDYLYINDLVRIVEYFLSHDSRHRIYNAARGSVKSLVAIAHKINKIAEKPSRIVVKNPGLNTEYSANNKRLSDELQNFRFTRFDNALRELYVWYKENINTFDRSVIEKDEYLRYCRTGE